MSPSSRRPAARLAALLVAVPALATVAVADADAGTRAAGAGALTRLGRASRPGVSGFGQSRPRKIFLGGDPTGLVEKIHWSTWGGTQASGGGEAEYVWPGTAVAANSISSGARVVAFHLGTCHGVRSYNALEWYFPREGGTFDPHEYINTCTGEPVGVPRSASCPDVTLSDGTGKATFVTAAGLSCTSAAAQIAVLGLAEYLPKGGRFLQSGFRCGSEGATEGSTPLFACQAGRREFSFFLEP